MNEAHLTAMRRLSDRDMAIFTTESARLQKSVGVTYLLWFFLGPFGVHKFYLGKVSGWAYLVSMVFILYALFNLFTSPVVILAPFAGIYLGLSLIWDLFTIPWQVSKVNEEASVEVLYSLLPDEEEEE